MKINIIILLYLLILLLIILFIYNKKKENFINLDKLAKKFIKNNNILNSNNLSKFSKENNLSTYNSTILGIRILELKNTK